MTSNEGEEVLPEEITKQSFRKKVWDYLEKNDIADIPRPVHGRIPNFKGSGEAGQTLKELDIFKKANVVKVNPDKPQETVRLLALEARKTVLVPIPRLRKGLFQQIQLPPGATNHDCRVASTRRGFEQFGKPVGLDSEIKVDLVVLGSVAVSKEGYRIGKGEGFADLEFAMMVGMGAVNDDTLIITTVHDCQVFDTLPQQLFKSHDVPVDIIVTPTQVLNVYPRLSRPTGIIWNILSGRRLNEMPILKTLRDKHIADGRDCTLKEVDSDIEERPIRPPRPARRERRNRNRPIPRGESQIPLETNSNPNEEIKEQLRDGLADEGGSGDAKLGQRSRFFRRRKRRSSRRNSTNDPMGQSPEPITVSDNTAVADGPKVGTEVGRERPRRRRTRRLQGEGLASQSPDIGSEKEDRDRDRHRRGPRRNAFNFSLRVDNIATNVRVRELKAALAERGVRPMDITWRGPKGFALLHFRNADIHENIVASLQGLRLRDGEDFLLVQPAQPTRVEVTDISSV